MELLGIPFIIDSSSFEDHVTLNLSPTEQAKQLALGKATEVASRHADSIIIGADTLISFNGEILGKPGTKENALKMLYALNGTRHSVFTGFSIIDTKTNMIFTDVVETIVYFRSLSEREIIWYVETMEPLDKAGGYGIQSKGALLIDHIEGDFNAVIGLPLSRLAHALEDFGVMVMS